MISFLLGCLVYMNASVRRIMQGFCCCSGGSVAGYMIYSFFFESSSFSMDVIFRHSYDGRIGESKGSL